MISFANNMRATPDRHITNVARALCQCVARLAVLELAKISSHQLHFARLGRHRRVGSLVQAPACIRSLSPTSRSDSHTNSNNIFLHQRERSPNRTPPGWWVCAQPRRSLLRQHQRSTGSWPPGMARNLEPPQADLQLLLRAHDRSSPRRQSCCALTARRLAQGET